MDGGFVRSSNDLSSVNMVDNLEELIIQNFSDVYNTEGKLEKIISSVSNLDENYQFYLFNLINKQSAKDIEVEGFTVKRLQDEHGMNLVASVLTLDYLKREPDQALKSLRKGHDFVG